MCVLFLFLAIFASFIHRIPRSGNWLFAVKFVIAATLFLVAAWLLRVPQIAKPIFQLSPLALSLFVVIASVGIARTAYRQHAPLLKVFSAMALAYGAYSLVAASHAQPRDQAIQNSAIWYSNSADALSNGRATHQITMIDIYADWCAACKELELETFPDARVQEELATFTKARVDYANEPDLIEQYEVYGLPCILFIGPDGTELPDSRIDGFVAPDIFASHLASLRSGTSIDREKQSPR
jgi:thiol:disulfide interchange protein DsbD